MNERFSGLADFWESVRKGQIAHFYLFHGETQRHRKQALALAAALNCQDKHGEMPKETPYCGECLACRKIFGGNHPDVEFVGPAKTSIGIEQVISLQKRASRKPYEGLFHVYLIEEADKLTLPASNALLVTAEEPPAQTVLILSCPSDAALLPTLRSRARAVYFPPDGDMLTDDEWEISETDWGEALRLSGQNVGLAREVARSDIQKLQELIYIYRDAVEERDFLRIFSLFPMERELAMVWLQVMAADTLTRLCPERMRAGGETRGAAGCQEAARILPWIEEALRALQRQADVRLTIEVLALKHMRGA
jgi:DNA polymerase-3 subunit delta'